MQPPLGWMCTSRPSSVGKPDSLDGLFAHTAILRSGDVRRETAERRTGSAKRAQRSAWPGAGRAVLLAEGCRDPFELFDIVGRLDGECRDGRGDSAAQPTR